MPKPVEQKSFWKQRIQEAAKEHFSVYITSEHDWQHLNEVHKNLLKMCTGKVLDAGCGYGRSSELFEADRYTGVDFSPDFIAMARDKYPNKVFVQASLDKLPFEDGAFDWAFCVSIKRMIQDNCGDDRWQEMQTEIKRVAKKLLILEYTDPHVHEIV